MTIKLGSKGGSAGSLVPIVQPVNLGADHPVLFEPFAFPGFAEDGDVITIPNVFNGGSIAYYNSSGVLQWSKTKADVSATPLTWVGFCFDKTDALIYGIAQDPATTPDTLYTFSINAAGTVVNIGNAQLGSDFTVAPAYNSASVSARSSVQRRTDGSGNLFILGNVSNGTEEAEINISNGAIVSDPSQIFTCTAAYNLGLAYKTADDYYCGLYSLTLGAVYRSYVNIFKTSGYNGAVSFDPPQLGQFHDQIYNTIQWGDYVGYIPTTTFINATQGARLFLKTSYDAWIKSIVDAMDTN